MASQDREKASANLLRRGLGDSGLPAGQEGDACPDPGILAAYFERSLDADETARYELHFSQCANCREQLAAMTRASAPAAAGSATPHAASHWAWLWDWRALAPVAAVLVLAAVWFARRPAPNRLADMNSQPPLVAMSRTGEIPANSTPAPAREQFATTPPPKPAPKDFAVPSAGVIGGLEQSRSREESATLDDKEKVASNLPSNSRNEIRSDELAKEGLPGRRQGEPGRTDQKALKRDYDAAKQASASETVAPSAPPAAPLQPPASANSSGMGGSAQRVITNSEVDSLAPTTPATRAKPSGAPAGARALTQQAQTQAVVQSQALALEAAEKRSAGTVIATPDPQVLWRLHDDGVVERSTDRGESWQRELQGMNLRVTVGSAPSSETCWLVGRAGVIYLTKDAKRWKKISPPLKADFVSVTAQDAASATITAADGRKFATSDGGKRWSPVP